MKGKCHCSYRWTEEWKENVIAHIDEAKCLREMLAFIQTGLRWKSGNEMLLFIQTELTVERSCHCLGTLSVE